MRLNPYDLYLGRLRRHVPLPVDIVFVRNLSTRTNDIACCSKPRSAQGRFRIEFDETLLLPIHMDFLAQLLIHEWAHALSWGMEKPDHGDLMGLAWSRCYRVAVEGWRPCDPW